MAVTTDLGPTVAGGAESAPRARPGLWLIILLTALGPLSLNIMMPVMPQLEDAFGASYGQVQLTLTLFLIGFAVSQLFYGPLSDRFGRRPLMLVGVTLFVFGSALAAAAPTVEVLVGARLIQAIGGCAGMVLGRAIIRDLYSRDASAGAIALVTAVMVVAPMISPVVGSTLDAAFNWRATMIAAGAVGVIALPLAILYLTETLRQKIALPGFGGLVSTYGRLLRRRDFRSYSIQIAFASAGFFCFLGGAPYVIQNIMGHSPTTYALYFILSAIGYMTGNFASSRYSTRFGVDRMVAAGLGLSLLSCFIMLALVWWSHPLALFGPMVLFAIGNGISLPNGTAGAVSVDPTVAGTAAGFAGFLQMGLGALGSLVAGWTVMGASSQLPLVAIMVAASAIGFVSAVRMLLRNRRADAAAAG